MVDRMRRPLDDYDSLVEDLLASRSFRVGEAIVSKPLQFARSLLGRPPKVNAAHRLEKVRQTTATAGLSEESRRLLDLLSRVLTDSIHGDPFQPYVPDPGTEASDAWERLRLAASHDNIELVRRVEWDPARRATGRDWPSRAETMVGLKRLKNLQRCIERTHLDEVPGDVVETGVWRGGAMIFARAVLRELGDQSRHVWLCDSFAGLPPPDPAKWPEDEGDVHHLRQELAVSVGQVRAGFERYGLLDDRVHFVEGWFEDTLSQLPAQEIAVLRLDGDMYGSTMVALRELEPRVPSGGFVIIDDYGAIAQCRNAVEDYRAEVGIDAPIRRVDWTGAYWRKP